MSTPIWEQTGPVVSQPRIQSSQPATTTGLPQHSPDRARNPGPLPTQRREDEDSGRLVTLDLDFRSPSWTSKSYGLRIIGVSSRAETGLQGNFISSIHPGSPAELCLELKIGDELVAVNDTYVRDLLHSECLDVLKSSPNPMHLTVLHNSTMWAKFQSASLEHAKAVYPAGLAAKVSRAAAPDPSMVHLSKVATTTELDSVGKGLKAYANGDMKIAERFFLEALHVEFDPDFAAAIVEASKKKDPIVAQTECNRIIALQQKQKAGVNYLLGLAVAAQGEKHRAQAPLVLAVKQSMEWMYSDGMKIDPEDPEFHHSIAVSLVAQNKLYIAAFAFQTAVRLRPLEKWHCEFESVLFKLGMERESLPTRAKAPGNQLHSDDVDESVSDDSDDENDATGETEASIGDASPSNTRPEVSLESAEESNEGNVAQELSNTLVVTSDLESQLKLSPPKVEQVSAPRAANSSEVPNSLEDDTDASDPVDAGTLNETQAESPKAASPEYV